MDANINFLRAHARVRQYARTQYVDYVIRLGSRAAKSLKLTRAKRALAKIAKFNRRN